MSRRKGTQEQARELFLAIGWIKPPPELVERVTKIHSAEAWETAAIAALRIDQEPLFLRFLNEHCPGSKLSLEIRSRLGAQDRYHAFRWAEIRECLEDVLRTLLEDGIRPILLKGISCVGDIYRPARLRPMRDIDLLVRPEQVQRAGELLRNRGYVHKENHPSEAYLNHHHLRPFFNPTSGICVELHHRPLAPDADLPGAPGIEEFWKNLRSSHVRYAKGMPTGNSVSDEAATLEPTLQALVTGLHFTHSESISRRISHLIDLARMIELHGGEMDWERLLQYAASPEIARSLTLSFSYLGEAGLPAAPPEFFRRLRGMARFDWWEWKLLAGLINRYRITIPSPWSRISTRIADILWRETIRSGNSLNRLRNVFHCVLSRTRDDG